PAEILPVQPEDQDGGLGPTGELRRERGYSYAGSPGEALDHAAPGFAEGLRGRLAGRGLAIDLDDPRPLAEGRAGLELVGQRAGFEREAARPVEVVPARLLRREVGLGEEARHLLGLAEGGERAPGGY